MRRVLWVLAVGVIGSSWPGAAEADDAPPLPEVFLVQHAQRLAFRAPFVLPDCSTNPCPTAPPIPWIAISPTPIDLYGNVHIETSLPASALSLSIGPGMAVPLTQIAPLSWRVDVPARLLANHGLTATVTDANGAHPFFLAVRDPLLDFGYRLRRRGRTVILALRPTSSGTVTAYARLGVHRRSAVVHADLNPHRTTVMAVRLSGRSWRRAACNGVLMVRWRWRGGTTSGTGHEAIQTCPLDAIPGVGGITIG